MKNRLGLNEIELAELFTKLTQEYIVVTWKDGRLCAIARMAYTFALLIDVDETGYSRRFCYESLQDAVRALNNWSGVGEPSGWHRDPVTGRRRPDGDHEREYVHW